MGDISLDDPRFKGGDPQYLFVNVDDEVGVLEGDNLEATLELPFIELIPGRIARVSRARPISDAIDSVSMRFNSRMRLGDSSSAEVFGDMEANGDIPCRISG